MAEASGTIKLDRFGSSRIVTVLVIALGLSLSAAGFFYLRVILSNYAEAQIAKEANIVSQSLQNRLDEMQDLVKGVGALLNASNNLTADEFSSYTKSVLPRAESIETIIWAPYRNSRYQVAFVGGKSINIPLLNQMLINNPSLAAATRNAFQGRIGVIHPASGLNLSSTANSVL